MRRILKALLHQGLTASAQEGRAKKRMEAEMYLRKGPGPRVVTLPDGSQLTQADLPPTGTTRWVARRKALVVMGVESGLISLEEAIERYDLSEEEYQSWANAISSHGTDGLKTTLLQQFR